MKSRCFWLWSPRTGATDIPRVGWLLGNTPLVGYSFASMTDESDENNGFLSIYTWCAPDIGCAGPVPGSGRVRGLGQTNPTKATALGRTCCMLPCLGVPRPTATVLGRIRCAFRFRFRVLGKQSRSGRPRTGNVLIFRTWNAKIAISTLSGGDAR